MFPIKISTITSSQRLSADPSRVVVRPFHIAVAPAGVIARGPSRVHRIVGEVLALSEEEATAELVGVLQATILFFLVASPVIKRVFRLKGADTGLEEAGTMTSTYSGAAKIA